MHWNPLWGNKLALKFNWLYWSHCIFPKLKAHAIICILILQYITLVSFLTYLTIIALICKRDFLLMHLILVISQMQENEPTSAQFPLGTSSTVCIVFLHRDLNIAVTVITHVLWLYMTLNNTSRLLLLLCTTYGWWPLPCPYGCRVSSNNTQSIVIFNGLWPFYSKMELD